MSVVCSILERDVAATVARLGQVPRGCGYVELRADALPGDAVPDLISRSPLPTIVTIRRIEDGGLYGGNEARRLSTFELALRRGAALVDVELGSAGERLAARGWGDRMVLSRHGVECTDVELAKCLEGMSRSPAGRLKIVAEARSAGELAAIRRLLAAAERPLAAFSTGRAGALSRILAPLWGSWATYGSVAAGAESAEGQFTCSRLVDVFDVDSIRAGTRRFALVGADVFRSPSPEIHRAGYRSLAIDATYVPLEIDALDEAAGLEFDGLAVTMPFKEAAAERCASLDEVARTARAVNTVRIDGDRWHGYNTDGPAAVDCVGGRIALDGARVAIVGAGGTAAAVAASMRSSGARVTLFNRDTDRAQRVGRRTGAAAGSLDELVEARWDVLVQATPLGAHGERVLPREALRGKVVIDAVYGPRTLLVAEALEQGLIAIDGFEFLVRQAARQFEILTGSAVAVDELRAAVDASSARR